MLGLKLLKGYSVHWPSQDHGNMFEIESSLGSSNKEREKKLFSLIAAHIQKAPCGEQFVPCFEVLCGSKPASSLLGNVRNFSDDDAT